MIYRAGGAGSGASIGVMLPFIFYEINQRTSASAVLVSVGVAVGNMVREAVVRVVIIRRFLRVS